MKKYFSKMSEEIEREFHNGTFHFLNNPSDLLYNHSTKKHLRDLKCLCRSHYQAMSESYGRTGSIIGAVTTPVIAALYDFNITLLRYGAANSEGRKARIKFFRGNRQ